ncbi:MAG: 5'-nucleotidase/apyrase family protein [Thermodesulfovibrionales bacterium]|nr:5'-nucleotidase/apyrase family protein [Thermodesulfovibrionales bacterium]
MPIKTNHRLFELKPILTTRLASLLIPFIVFIVLSCTSSTQQKSLTLNILHINDTHSHLEPDSGGVNMVFNGIATKAFLGGFSRIKTAVDRYRETRQNVLFCHAGDAVQGTLYFTKFQGDADIEFLNLIGIDVMTFGNHEFDKGTIVPKKLVKNARFDIVSANIDFSQEPEIHSKVRPYVVKYFNSQPVAIIGVTTEDTVTISGPLPTIKFTDVIETLKVTVKEIEDKSIDKIIVISHIGYDADKKVAQEVSGIDVIVGGHSHTLLGDKEYSDFGLVPEGSYPTVIKKNNGDVVLIVQAWKWGQVLGAITVDFDEQGKIKDYKAEQVILINDRFIQNRQEIHHDSETYNKIIDSINRSNGIRIFPEDTEVLKYLAPLKTQIDDLKRQVLAVAEDDLIIGLNSGPGPLVIDSFVAKTNADIGLINRGSIRRNLSTGDITLGDVYEVMPFGNTLFIVYLKGYEIKQILEDGIDFQVTHNPNDPYYPYVSGIKYSVRPKEIKGRRVYELFKKNNDGTIESLNMVDVYKFVTIGFIAKQGGDGFVFFNNFKGNVIDTGLLDVDVFSEYLSYQRTIYNPTEERIRIDVSSNIQQTMTYLLFAIYNFEIHTLSKRLQKPCKLDKANSTASFMLKLHNLKS